MKLSCVLLLLFISAITAVGQNAPQPPLPAAAAPAGQTESAEAFTDFAFGSLLINPNNLTEKKIAELRADFFAPVKPHLIESGAAVERLKRLAAPVFRFHRAAKSQTVVFSHRVPIVFTWKETFVTFSTAALDLLSDDEITALVAHEVGHLYFAAALEAARNAGDDRLTRVIELKCDLAALTTLTRLKLEPANLISAVKKLIEMRDRQGIGSLAAGSPTIASREEILKLYLSAQNRHPK